MRQKVHPSFILASTKKHAAPTPHPFPPLISLSHPHHSTANPSARPTATNATLTSSKRAYPPTTTIAEGNGAQSQSACSAAALEVSAKSVTAERKEGGYTHTAERSTKALPNEEAIKAFTTLTISSRVGSAASISSLRGDRRLRNEEPPMPQRQVDKDEEEEEDDDVETGLGPDDEFESGGEE